MNGQPNVSVVIPTRNRKPLIRNCIESVLAQTYADFEILVVDDGSTDGTQENFRMDSRYRDIRYLRHETSRGAQAARNTGIRASRGRYIAFLDSDDEWMPKKLECQIKAAGDEDVVVHCDALILDENSGHRQSANVPPIEGQSLRALLAAPGPLLQCLLAPRWTFERAGFLDEAVPAYQEWDTSLALARFCAFRFVPAPLVCYRLHGSEQISKDLERAARGYLYIVRKHHQEILSLLGRRAMARHYLAISERFLAAGKHRNSAIYVLAAFRFSPSSVHLAARAGILLCGERGALVLARRRERQQTGSSLG